MKLIFLPPIAPALFLIVGLAVAILSSRTLPEATVRFLMLSPGIYLFCTLLNAVEFAIAKLLGRFQLVSLIVTPVCLGGLGLAGGRFSGTMTEKLLLAFGGATILIFPMGLLRRRMARSAELGCSRQRRDRAPVPNRASLPRRA